MQALSFVLFTLFNFLRWGMLSWGWSDANNTSSPIGLATILTFASTAFVYFYTFRRPQLLAKLHGKKRALYLLMPTLALIGSFAYNASFEDPTATMIFVILPYAILLAFDLAKSRLLRV